MNPFNNRWLALFVIVGLLLVVAELVGTGERGGVLSQTAQSQPNGENGAKSAAAPVETIHEPPSVVEDASEDVPEEDQPQVVMNDDVDDSSDLSSVEDPGAEIAEEALPEDDSGDE
ncbi:MAG TPA: hypothetical protein VL100_13530 [Croceibacterium sp.]|nr:hypothetical protein [Croceibacterium sp.]